MALVALPPVVNPVSTYPYTVYDDKRFAHQAWWGEEAAYGGPWDPLTRFRNNVTLAHVLPIGVNGRDIENFMAPKALQSDVGSLMPLTHNTRRKVPRHPTPTVFPQNEPCRKTKQGSFALSQPTRQALDDCSKNLYITPWASKTSPDFTLELMRNKKMEHNSTKLQRSQTVREPKNGYESFRYSTIYRESYSKTSLLGDQSKVYLPPIQRKISYANSLEDVQDDEEDETCTEYTKETRHARDDEQETNSDHLCRTQGIPFCDSLINIRGRLGSEGWVIPTIYTRRHPSYAGDFESHMTSSHLNQCQDASCETSSPHGTLSGIRTPCQKRIRCDSANLLSNQLSNSGKHPASPRIRAERVKIHPPNVAQTRIVFPQKRPCTPRVTSMDTSSRSSRRVRFDLNQPDVHSGSAIEPYFSLRHTPQEKKDVEDTDAEWGTDEMLKEGFRRKTLLPRLQVPDFKTLCHSKHHLQHLEAVPDLRDFTTYTKKVYFDGINSSVYRG